jgi:hypothetical protein
MGSWREQCAYLEEHGQGEALLALKRFAANLDNRYELRRQRLTGTITAAPMIGGRSTGQLVATVGGVAGVRVGVSTDLRTPLVVGDNILVEGVGSPAAMAYNVVSRLSGSRPDSDVFLFPAATSAGGTSYEAGDILLGSTLAGWSNWWYQFLQGRWIIRQGTVMHGAIGNLDDLYDYTSVEYGTVFGEYEAGHIWLAMDPTNGFRIMLYDKRTFQAAPTGVTSFGVEGETEIEIDPAAQTIAFKIGGQVVSYVGQSGALVVDNHRCASFIAEFPGAVLDLGSSGSNVGTMTGKYDATNRKNYYDWTTSESGAQDYDVVLQTRLPHEFAAFDTVGLTDSWIYVASRVTGSSGSTYVELVELLDSIGVNRITPTALSNLTWGSDGYQLSSGSFLADDTITMRFKLRADPGKHAQLHSAWFNWLARES